MTDCTFNPLVDAYHDGQLSIAERSAFEAHLPGCSECATRLAELQSMSNLFAVAPAARLSQISLHRLHHKIADEMDSGLVRIAWTLSGIAASIMLVGSALLMRIPGNVSPSPQAAPPWVGVSASLETDTLAQNVGTPTAQWYLADALHGTDESIDGH